MLKSGDAVLLGVSGGPDSVALLIALSALSESHAMRWILHVLHVHHHLRGKEADADASFVEELSSRFGAAFHVEHSDVAELATRRGMSLETAGRACRYEAYEKMAAKLNLTRVALGHTADDNAETILHRVIRGTGLKGLAGIPPTRPVRPASHIIVIRPLIECTRNEVEAYLEARGVSARIDSSNLAVSYTRNRIRNELLPLLERGYNLSVREALLRLGRIARAADELLEARAEEQIGDATSIDVSHLLAMPAALQLACMARLIQNAGLQPEFSHVEQAIDLAGSSNPSGTVQLPAGFEVKRSYDRLSVARRAAPHAPPEQVRLPVPGEVRFGDYLIRAEQFSAEGFSLKEFIAKKTSLEEAVDAQCIGPRLTVRPRQPGDRFHLLGSPGERRLKELLIDRKVPREKRDSMPLVCAQERIIWVAGIGISESVKITPATESVVLLSAVKAPDHHG